MEITNNRDYRTEYMILGLLEDVEQKITDFEKAEVLHQRIIDTKRSLRKYLHRDGSIVDVGMGFTCEHRIIKGDYDGYIELVSIPAVFDTLEDTEDGAGAETFFHDFLEYHYRPSQYDCTGQAFTNWFKLFKRRGQFWAYHSVSYDH